MTEIVAEKWEEATAREALLDLCMPDRFEKSSERLREGRCRRMGWRWPPMARTAGWSAPCGCGT